MKLICSFYIGHQDYLDDAPTLSEDESHEKLAALVYDIVFRNIGDEQFEVYVPKNAIELRAELTVENQTFEATGFSTETAVADDQEGLPVLFYVNAHFEISDELDIDESFEAKLWTGEFEFEFQGVPEIEDEEY
jgi:hypothetical protein